MEALRQFLRTWLGKIIVAIILAPMAILLGVTGYQTTRTSNDVVATIEDVTIYPRQLEDGIRQEKQRIESQFGLSPSYNEAELKKQVLKSLIDKTALEIKADELGLAPTEAIIAQQIQQDPMFQDEQGRFSQSRFETLLKNTGLTKHGLIAQEKQRQAMVGLAGGISQTAFITKPALERVVELQSQTRHVWLHRVSATDFVGDVSVSPSQIDNYYAKHKDELKTDEQVDLAYIVLPSSQFAEVQVTQDELKSAYQSHIAGLGHQEERVASHILFAGKNAKAEADKTLARIQAGEDFAKLAKQLSKDPGSAAQGGKLGAVQKGVYGDAFDNALFGLAVDKMTTVETSFGAHVVRLDAINQAKTPTLDELKAELEPKIKAQKQDAAFQDAISRINESAISGLSIDDIAQAENLTLGKRQGFTKTPVLDLKQPELAHPEVIKQVFDEFNLEDQAVSVAITKWADKAVWVQSSNHKPVRQKTKEEAREEISQTLTEQQAKKRAKARAEKVAAEVSAMNDIQAAAANLGIAFEDLGVVSRQAPMLTDAERTQAFSLQVQEKGLIAGVQDTDLGYSVLAVKQPEKTEDDAMATAQKAQLSELFKNVKGQEVLMDYIDYLRSDYDVDINKKALEAKAKAP